MCNLKLSFCQTWWTMKFNEHMGNVWEKELGHIEGELLAMRHLNSRLRATSHVRKRVYRSVCSTQATDSDFSPFLFLCNRKRTARVRCWSTCGRCCRWYPTTSSRQTTPARKCWSAHCSRCGSAGSTWPTSAACRRLPWWRTASWAAPCHSRPSSWTWCTTNRNRRPPRSYRSGVCHISAGQLRDTQYTVDHDRTRQDANVDDEHAWHIAAGRSLDHGRMEFIKQ